MATASQLEDLIKAHMNNDNMKFKTIVLKIAAYEARQNHPKLARELSKLVEKPVQPQSNVVSIGKSNSMLDLSVPNLKLNNLIVSDSIKQKIIRILKEYQNKNKLRQYGLQNRKKILIEGPPGTGKTYTASIIASELRIPLYTVQMDKLVTKYMGETSVKLRKVFDSIQESRGVYLFDEFDAIGTDRNIDNEVGEMRRVLNSFLQFIEEYDGNSIIICATNNKDLLDHALFRRFDDVLHYGFPTKKEIKNLFLARLGAYQTNFVPSSKLVNAAISLSQAEIVRVCNDAMKNSIMTHKQITEQQLIGLINERQSIYSNKEA